MDLELDGKVAVVTGAGKGIGLAVVDTLLAEGMHVVAGARTIDSLRQRVHVTAVAVDLVEPGGAEINYVRRRPRQDHVTSDREDGQFVAVTENALRAQGIS